MYSIRVIGVKYCRKTKILTGKIEMRLYNWNYKCYNGPELTHWLSWTNERAWLTHDWHIGLRCDCWLASSVSLLQEHRQEDARGMWLDVIHWRDWRELCYVLSLVWKHLYSSHIVSTDGLLMAISWQQHSFELVFAFFVCRLFWITFFLSSWTKRVQKERLFKYAVSDIVIFVKHITLISLFIRKFTSIMF